MVVQLVRMPACHAGGRGFESRPFRKRSLNLYKLRLFCFLPIDVIVLNHSNLSSKKYFKWYSGSYAFEKEILALDMDKLNIVAIFATSKEERGSNLKGNKRSGSSAG